MAGPDKPWFRERASGGGSSPASWQGWLIALVVFVAVVAFVAWVRAHPMLGAVQVVVVFGVGTVALLFGLVWLIIEKSGPRY